MRVSNILLCFDDTPYAILTFKLLDLIPDVSKNEIDAMVFSSNPSLYPASVKAASILRNSGIKVDLVLENKKTKWAFQRADKIGAKVVIMVAEEEYKEDKVIVRNLVETGPNKQTTSTINSLSETVRNILENIKRAQI